jgi:hypothetical protein
MQPFPPALSIPFPRVRLLSAGVGDSLEELSITVLPDGAICSVATVGVYQLDKTSVAAVSAPDVIATFAGSGAPGRWLLITGVSVADVIDPFLAQYYVDPTFVGISTGSASNPFTSIADAFAAATALALPGAVLILPDKATVTENVVFPEGGDWEITSAGRGRSTLAGTVDCTTIAQGVRRLTQLFVTGAVSGQSTAESSFLFLANTVLISTLTLTKTGSGYWRTICDGAASPFFVIGGGVLGTCAVVGEIFASLFHLPGSVTAFLIEASECIFTGPNIVVNGGTRSCILRNCRFEAAMTFTGSGGIGDFVVDPWSEARLLDVGLSLVSASLTNENSNATDSSTIAANVPATYFNGSAGALSPPGLYEAVATLYLTTAGTAGTAVVNVIYTDLGGVLRTLPVTSGLTVAGAPGTENRGSAIPFAHDGSTSIQFSVTGITTPGAFEAELRVAIRRVN